ncbi:MAG: PH domain-containing protein [archaeon]|nr:PH domain-containing protein [archaeon]
MAAVETPVIEDLCVVVVQKDTVADLKEAVVVEGWLLQTNKKKNSFKKMYIMLRRKPQLTLCSYEKQYDPKSRKPVAKETIIVKDIQSVKPLPKAKKPFAIELTYQAPGQTTLYDWLLSASSEGERQSWLHHIRSVLTLEQDDDSLQGADQFDLHADTLVAKQDTSDPLMTGFV